MSTDDQKVPNADVVVDAGVVGDHDQKVPDYKCGGACPHGSRVPDLVILPTLFGDPN
jgi:hypothetical protein